MIFSFTHHGESKPPLWVQGEVFKDGLDVERWTATSPQLPGYSANDTSIIATVAAFRTRLGAHFVEHPEQRNNQHVRHQ